MTKLDCLVIGAGISGLVAMKKLRDYGLVARLLEAGHRIGGRILTDNVFGESSFDFGARYIGSSHLEMLTLCSALGIALKDHGRGDYRHLLPECVYGERAAMTVREVQDLQQEVARACEGLSELVDGAGDRNHERLLVPGLGEARNIPVDRWLEHVRLRRAEDFFSDLPVNGQSLAGLLQLVAAGGGLSFFEETERFSVAGGTGLVTSKLAECIGDEILLGQTALGVREERSSVSVTTMFGTQRATACIIALPLSLLGPLIGTMPTPLVAYARSYWTIVRGRAASPPGSLRECLRQNDPRIVRVLEVDGRSFIAEAYVSGRTTNRSAILGKISAALRAMGIRTDNESLEVRRHIFHRDPLLRAAVAYVRCGSPNEDLAPGCAPIWFAGDAWSTKFCGYMEGAVRSGLKAASSVMEFLSR